MLLDDLPADRQTESGARHLAAMQAFEQTKNALVIRLVDSDTVIPHEEAPQVSVWLGANLDSKRRRASILDSVADQVLEQLHELTFIAQAHGERANRHERAA